MQLTFPAMKGVIGKREYYSTIVSLSEIPHLFKFNDWAECTPELRAQRPLNESRVPAIARYILENEDGYLFASITASYDAKSGIRFVPGERDDIGKIEMELERAQFVINDGQHRCAAIAQALKENPSLAKEKISVLLFPMEDMDRLQQMFSDLNRYVQKTSKSLNILYDHRDSLSSLTMDVSETVDVFRGMIDRENITIPIRSPKLFALSTLYDANNELFGGHVGKKGTDDYRKALQLATTYWNELTKSMTDWKKVKSGEMMATQLRQEKICSHAIVVRALGGLGRSLLEAHPSDWQIFLTKLADVDWRKAVGNRVNPTWEKVCIIAGSVVSNRQARAATLHTLKKLVGIEPATKVKQVAQVDQAKSELMGSGAKK